MAMNFVKTEPKKYRYVVDVQAVPKTDYKPTYEAFGWEYVGQMASIFVWRKQYDNERPESFSDKENRIARNKRLTAAISFSFILFLLTSLSILTCFIWNFNRLTIGGLIQFILGSLLSCGLTICIGYVMWKISKNREK